MTYPACKQRASNANQIFLNAASGKVLDLALRNKADVGLWIFINKKQAQNNQLHILPFLSIVHIYQTAFYYLFITNSIFPEDSKLKLS